MCVSGSILPLSMIFLLDFWDCSDSVVFWDCSDSVVFFNFIILDIHCTKPLLLKKFKLTLRFSLVLTI
jgi:hypothetical protein